MHGVHAIAAQGRRRGTLRASVAARAAAFAWIGSNSWRRPTDDSRKAAIRRPSSTRILATSLAAPSAISGIDPNALSIPTSTHPLVRPSNVVFMIVCPSLSAWMRARHVAQLNTGG